MPDLPTVPGPGGGTSETPPRDVAPAGLRFVPIATSRDMMAPASTFCPQPQDFFGRPVVDAYFPYLWRSSVAVSVAEDPTPDPCTDEAALQTCYVKVTATITGFQARPEDIGLFPTFLAEAEPQLQRLITPNHAQYLACYGALLRVQVFPPDDDEPIDRYPVIVDFEPKMRDLYQPATETSQMLSGSESSAKIDRSTKSIQSTEWSLSGTVTASSEGQQSSKGGVSASVTGGYKSTSGAETTGEVGGEEGLSSQRASGAAVNISQIYSVLTGYHAGTNTASILIQPRPHIEQSEHTIRNFVPGLRAIEGIQEAVFVVTRPKSMRGMRVQATLETAHLTTAAVTPRPTADRNPSRMDRPDTRSLTPGLDLFQATDLPFLPKYTAYSNRNRDPASGDYAQWIWLFEMDPAVDAEGYELEIDTSAGDGAEHPGVTKVLDLSPRHDQSRILMEEYGAIGPTTFRVAISQRPDVPGTDGPPDWLKVYAPWVRRRYPDPVLFNAQVATLLTVRDTCGKYEVDAAGCVQPLRTAVQHETAGGQGETLRPAGGSRAAVAETPLRVTESISAEREINLPLQDVGRTGAVSSAAAVNREIRGMLTAPTRPYPAGAVHLATSDHAAGLIARHLPAEVGSRSVQDVETLPPTLRSKATALTVGDVFAKPLSSLADTLSVPEAATLRAELLRGISEQ